MKVLVLCGGRSAEREVSCVSAAAILRNLHKRHEPLLVHIDAQGLWRYQKNPKVFASHPRPFAYPFDHILARLEPGTRPRLLAGPRRLAVDVVFPILHGPLGEDGTLQGLLEFVGLPYVGAGVLGSAVGMDKVFTKRLVQEAGIPVLPYVVLEGDYDIKPAQRLKFPVFVKPSRLGSSVGVYKVEKASALTAALSRAFRFDTTVIVEQGVPAREIECALLGTTERVEAAPVVGEIRPNDSFYSYKAKYLDPQGAQLLVPAELSSAQAQSVRGMALRAFQALGGYGMARADFLMDKRNGRIWFNEVNTLPGFTSISMYPKLWEASGLPFTRLIDRLIDLALLRYRQRSRLRMSRD